MGSSFSISPPRNCAREMMATDIHAALLSLIYSTVHMKPAKLEASAKNLARNVLVEIQARKCPNQQVKMQFSSVLKCRCGPSGRRRAVESTVVLKKSCRPLFLAVGLSFFVSRRLKAEARSSEGIPAAGTLPFLRHPPQINISRWLRCICFGTGWLLAPHLCQRKDVKSVVKV